MGQPYYHPSDVQVPGLREVQLPLSPTDYLWQTIRHLTTAVSDLETKVTVLKARITALERALPQCQP